MKGKSNVESDITLYVWNFLLLFTNISGKLNFTKFFVSTVMESSLMKLICETIIKINLIEKNDQV